MKIYFNTCLIILLLLMIGTSACNQKRTVNAENKEQILTEVNALYYNCDYNSAVILFDMLIENDSLKGELFYKRAYCKAQMLDYESAKKDYLKAVEFNYRIADAYLSLGILECITNDSLAVKYFDQVLSIDSTNIKAKALRIGAIMRLEFLKSRKV
jgi:tetratricopeptide (TPR) repeat protein